MLKLILVVAGVLIGSSSITTGLNSSLFPPLPSDIDDALSNAPLGRVDHQTVVKAWTLFSSRAPLWVDNLANSFNTTLQEILPKTNVSERCSSSLNHLLFSIKSMDEWAMKLVDSWGKFPMSGILEGTFTDFGSYDECLGIPPNEILGEAQYCSLELRPLLPPRPRFHNLVNSLDHHYDFSSLLGNPKHINKELISKSHFFYYITFRIGSCLPSKCSLDEIDKLINQVAKKYVLQGRATRCEVKEQCTTLDGYQVTAVVVLLMILLITLLGTCFDIFVVKNANIPVSKLSSGKRCFVAFSIPRNFSSVWDTGNTTETSLGCLHGFRFLTIGWVVMGHTYALTNHQAFGKWVMRQTKETDDFPAARGFRITDIVTEFSGQWFFNATLSVDTFFFMSGVLTTYVTWKITKGNHKVFNAAAFILARVLRLTPPMMVVVVFTFLLPLFGSGPGWHETIDPVVNSCKKNWYLNFLYLNNWIDSRNICLLHTWYLSCDMHFHIMSLIVILPLLRSRLVGMSVNATLLFGSILLAGIINYTRDYPPAMLYTQPEIEERWDLNFDYYWKPWSHVGSYCIGLTLGYILAHQNVNRLSYRQRAIGWVGALVILFIALFGVYPWNNGVVSHPAINALYSATHRTFWSIGLAWIVYSCVTGHGGFVNSFLAWKGFVAMSRLTFMVYLVHPWLIWLYMGNLRRTVDTSHYTGFYMFIPHWVLSYVVGLILSLLIESPVMVLQKELIAKLTGMGKFKLPELPQADDANDGNNVAPPAYTPSANGNGHTNHNNNNNNGHVMVTFSRSTRITQPDLDETEPIEETHRLVGG